MAEARTIQVAILRCDPDVDSEPYRQTFTVPLSPGMSVLNILTYIYENLDPGLGFYNNCDRGVCGRCTLTVNGHSALSCTTLVDGDLELEPLRGRPLVRDLLVHL
jgi:succinate dehydrogenase/fumarate reductase-like Fe-S protein